MPNLSINKPAFNAALNQFSNTTVSAASKALNYVKENPYKVAAAVITTAIVAPLAFIAGRAAWNVNVLCDGSRTFCAKAQFSNRASAGFNAASDAVKSAAGSASNFASTAAAGVKSAATSAANAAKTVGTKVGVAAATVTAAAASFGGKVADVVAGTRPITDASCLVIGSPLVNDKTTVILANNCARVGGLKGAFANTYTFVSEKAGNATLSATNAASDMKAWTFTKMSNAATSVSSAAKSTADAISSIPSKVTSGLFGKKPLLFNGTHSNLGPRPGFQATWFSK
jgi:phage-related protein